MATFSLRVQTGNDDGFYSGFESAYRPGYNFIAFGKGTTNHIGCLRFDGVDIGPGSTINSATITFYFDGGTTSDQTLKIYGIDEDNTASMATDPTGRTKTTANVDWDFTATPSGEYEITSDISSIIQEIVDRAGWSSGNAMGFLIENDGGTTGHFYSSYENDAPNSALLEIDYTGSSPSASISPSSSSSLSVSPSPSPAVGNFFGMKIAKPGFNVLETQEPGKLVFDSTKGTLKYFDKQTLQLNIDGGAGDFTGKTTYTHNLGYYPFVEVFARVYIGSPSGNYEYCPFEGSGASVTWGCTYKITETDITVYGNFGGVSTSTWTFDFLIFIYKNDLKLN